MIRPSNRVVAKQIFSPVNDGKLGQGSAALESLALETALTQIYQHWRSIRLGVRGHLRDQQISHRRPFAELVALRDAEQGRHLHIWRYISYP